MKILIKFIVLSVFVFSSSSSFAWYKSGTNEWQYRVPINIPAGAAVNSTVKFDVDFSALMTTLGISGNFDANSPRIVRPNETLVSTQEFTDGIYNGVIDPASNAKGEIKFILQDAGPSTYYLYFDKPENGAKPANPQPTINGNFEHSSGSVPTNWTTSSKNAKGAQNNEVYDTNFGATYSGTTTCNDLAIKNLDVSPNNAGNASNTTGKKWHLLGYRNNCEDGASNTSEQITLSRVITVPASNAGYLDFYFQLQAYDSFDGLGSKYDFFQITVNNASINHTGLNISNGELKIGQIGIGRKNQYSASLVDAGWERARLNLSSYANQTITISFNTNFFKGDNSYRSWIKLDDVEWSVVIANLGVPEAQAHEELKFLVQKESVVINDFINSSNPKRIPGSIIEYTITASNTGTGVADANSIEINDMIPPDTNFVTNSMQFIAGSSGLTAGASEFSYSTDGITFSSNPSSATKYIRVNPLGEFAASDGVTNPSFQVKFQVVIK